MAKKKAAKKKATKKTAKKGTAKKKTSRSKPAAKKTAKKKAPAKKAAPKKKAAKKSPPKKKPVKKKPAKKKAAPAAKKSPPRKVQKAKPSRKKGVRRATISAVVSRKNERKLGRSRVPPDAPLAVVFQNDLRALEAFAFLEIQTISELEEFNPDELVRRLSSPAKQTVGRIRKMLAVNNRCLTEDEGFALEFQERLTQNHFKLR